MRMHDARIRTTKKNEGIQRDDLNGQSHNEINSFRGL